MTPVMIALTLVVAAPAPKEAPKKDAPSLVGQWTPIHSLKGGKPDTPEPGSSITFTADGKVQLKEGMRERKEEATYTLDSKKEPAEIDIVPPEKAKESSIVGIYKFEKDTLVLCITMGADRPKKFESPEGSHVILITLQRAKKD